MIDDIKSFLEDYWILVLMGAALVGFVVWLFIPRDYTLDVKQIQWGDEIMNRNDAEVEKDWKAESDKWETMYRTVAAQLDRTSAALYSTETALKAMKNRVRKAEGTYIHPDDDDSDDYDDEVSAVEWKARYEAERKMRMELQSKVIALNTQLAAEKGILLG